MIMNYKPIMNEYWQVGLLRELIQMGDFRLYDGVSDQKIDNCINYLYTKLILILC